jgi:hypothetical protein
MCKQFDKSDGVFLCVILWQSNVLSFTFNAMLNKFVFLLLLFGDFDIVGIGFFFKCAWLMLSFFFLGKNWALLYKEPRDSTVTYEWNQEGWPDRFNLKTPTH